MKHLWLIATTMLAFSFHTHASDFEQREEMDIEAEAMDADARGAEYNAAYLNQKEEQQKLDTRLDVSHAEKVIHDSKTQQVYSEALIGKAEAEIAVLKKQQANALARRDKAREDRKYAIAKLQKTVKELKAYRAHAKRAQSLAMQDERSLNAMKARNAKLQSLLPSTPVPHKLPLKTMKARPSKASMAQAR